MAAAELQDEKTESADPAQTARRRTQLALAIMLALVIALTALAAFATSRLYLTSENRYIKEAFPLRSRARDVMLQMLNEETAVRGYLITADPANLQPYEEAKPAVAADLATLDRLTAGARRSPPTSPS